MQFYQCVTDFIFIEDKPRRSDIIFVPGGNYPDAAKYAAKLYHEGYAPYVMPSGRYSILAGRFHAQETEEKSGEAQSAVVDRNLRAGREAASDQDKKYETECDYLCDVLRRCGVPDQAILREEQATYTYENAIFSRKRTDALGMQIDRAILCCQAFHARRCLMYYQEQFPDTEFLLCPVVTKNISRESWHRTREGIDTVLGELERCGGQFHEIMYAKMEDERGRQSELRKSETGFEN